MSSQFEPRSQMQDRLFSGLSAMFGREVPLYDKSLLVNQVVNRAACDLLAKLYRGFFVTDEKLATVGGERHGAIRIGTPEEFRWITRFFACFGMEPHGFYDLTSIGPKSQPVVATAFRSAVAPEHRVFASLLQTVSFGRETRERVEQALDDRQVLSDRAKHLIESAERDGGLSSTDSSELIRLATDRIFRWTGTARDHGLYVELCDTGYKIAADIACFDSHHLNHLTPNTVCMDLFTASMRYCMGVIDSITFRSCAETAVSDLLRDADLHWMALHFRHLSSKSLDSFEAVKVANAEQSNTIESLFDRLSQSDLELHRLPHAGFKEATEGPPTGIPALLRQDAYRALTESVIFRDQDGSTVDSSHTARFGEIEQRFYATTPAGRALYDECLRNADTASDQQRRLEAFASFPQSLDALLQQGIVYGLYSATPHGIEAARSGVPLGTNNIHALIRRGFVRAEGQRYEDFLPFSAAGIFSSNLDQRGSKPPMTTAQSHTESDLEDIMDRKIIDPNRTYARIQAQSLLETFTALGLLDQLDSESAEILQTNATVCPDQIQTERLL